jgi:hypothetical protein
MVRYPPICTACGSCSIKADAAQEEMICALGRYNHEGHAGAMLGGVELPVRGKRHIAVDALGLVLTVVITAASVQDRDAARPNAMDFSMIGVRDSILCVA